MATLVLLILLFFMVAHSSATWCVCKKGGNDKVLQMAIDYACGNGADCTQTHQGGRCYNPDTVIDHCNYAVNSYFQNKGQTPEACNFNGAAMVVTADPSYNGCSYPSSASGTTVTNGNTKAPGSTTVTTGGTTTNPYGNNPTNTGILGGGIGPGMGPSGAGINTDVSHGFMLYQERTSFGLLAIMGSAFVMLWLD
ncbi:PLASMODESMATA CALLOSE-BINDING PROTEIN 3-like [Rutidosis leptorrhynchoides]|uniref:PLASMODESMATA CALLOSE-BINDING PROTEIN 3-like n=1 Tax=Rutidosis leptorrhynchoides TaxID=125765 RepID=UPI003A99A157